LLADDAHVDLSDLARASSLGERLEELRGRSLLIVTRDQLTAALALIELDGVARRMVLCPPDLPREHLAHVVTASGADALVCDEMTAKSGEFTIPLCVTATQHLLPGIVKRHDTHRTEWILLTSGTTGAPKLVLHTLETLAGALRRPLYVGPRPRSTASAPRGGEQLSSERPGDSCSAVGEASVWSTFYDIRRYGGLQIFLRAVLGGASLVLSSAQETTREFLARAGAAAVTHISGTPSHWRRALMSGAAHLVSPQYVRLSGEIADQAVLDGLRAAYPRTKVAHAFASTEAGVAFDVGDGLAGFPAALLGRSDMDVEMRVIDGTLRIRSPRNAIRYLDADAAPLAGEQGFVDTDDMVEPRGDRYHFVGRKSGVINVGGLKVHPEEVEAVINAHPRVRMCLVRARRSPITGSVVTADIVLSGASGNTDDVLRHEITGMCRSALPPHKVPAVLRFVPALEMSASGKLVRPHA
jgi:acyl-CoA synthetase (AMP-forming)/AMP-acid ligase II